jgi:hypothetical protein
MFCVDRKQQEAVVVHLKSLSWLSSGGIEENHKIPHIQILMWHIRNTSLRRQYLSHLVRSHF